MSRSESWAEWLYSRLGWRGVVAYVVAVWVTSAPGWAFLVVLFIRWREVPVADARIFSAQVALVYFVSLTISVVYTLYACQPLRRFSEGKLDAAEAWRSAVGLPYTVLRAIFVVGGLFGVPASVLCVFRIQQPSVAIAVFCLLPQLGLWLYFMPLGIFAANVVSRPILQGHRSPPRWSSSGGVRSAVDEAAGLRTPRSERRDRRCGCRRGTFAGEDIEAALIRMGIATALAAAAAIPVTLMFARSVRDPIADLLEGTKRIKSADYSKPVPELSSDELGQLARSFNEAMKGLTERQRLARENRVPAR